MRLILTVLLASLLVLIAPAPFDPLGDGTAAAQDSSDVGLMAVSRPPGKVRVSYQDSTGWVTAVDAASLTVRRDTDGDMASHGRPRPIVRFTACEGLAAGRNRGSVLVIRNCYAFYTLAEVRVGDLVRIEHESLGHVNGRPEVNLAPVLYQIEIFRRPGGRLGPPSVELVGPPGMRYLYKSHLMISHISKGAYPHHVWVNAFQDYEERGIPLPPDMRPLYTTSIPFGMLRWDGTIEPPRNARELAAMRPGGGGYPLWDGRIPVHPLPRCRPQSPEVAPPPRER